jgi:predicted RNA-binding Zn ribbon-like protein
MNTSHSDFLAQGHGKTAAWLDLVNSEEWDAAGRFTEHLDNPAWVCYFLRQWHFAKPSRATIPIAQLKALRAALRKSSEALFRGNRIPPAKLRTLNEVINVKGKQRLSQGQNGLHIEFVPDRYGWNWILAEIARSFVRTVTDGEAARIKICRNDHCRWVFYDLTKAKSRLWCSSKSCGNRERVRRARARAKN